MTVEYNKLVGYDLYANLLQSSALEKVGRWCATTNFGVICGSAAVAIHLGKDIRAVSPDLDILISNHPEAIASALSTFGKEHLSRNRFGFSNMVDDMETDWLIAKGQWQMAAIENAVTWNGLAVMSLPFLIISKLISNRDKDRNDLQLIFNKNEKAFGVAHSLLKTLNMEKEAQDLKSDLHLFRLLKS